MKFNLKRLLPGIGTITLFALYLRLQGTQRSGLTTDEANGVAISMTGTWADMVQHLMDDGNAPAFYSMVRILCQTFGDNDEVLKIFAIFISVLEVPVSYWLLRRQLPKHICLQLALLLACDPSLVRWNNLVRPYGLLSILGLVCTISCVRTLAKGSSKVWAPIYGLTTALVVYSHYWGAFVPIGQACMVVIGWFRGWFGKKELLTWLAGVAISLLVFAPQMGILFYQVKHDLSPWDMVPPLMTLVAEFFPSLLLDLQYGWNADGQVRMITCNLLILLTLISPSVLMIPRMKKIARPLVEVPENQSLPAEEQDGWNFDGRLWKTTVICGLLGCFLVNFILPSMRYRYMMPFVPLVFVVYMTGIEALFKNRSKWLKIFLCSVIWLFMFQPEMELNAVMPETTTLNVVEKINKEAVPGKDMVFISWQIITPAILRNLNPEIECLSFPDLNRSTYNYWPGMTERVREGGKERFDKLFPILEKVLARGGKIYVIEWAHDVIARDYTDHKMVENTSFHQSWTMRCDQIRTWLTDHATQEGTNILAPGRDFNIFLSIFRPRKEGEETVTLPKIHTMPDADSETNQKF